MIVERLIFNKLTRVIQGKQGLHRYLILYINGIFEFLDFYEQMNVFYDETYFP